MTTQAGQTKLHETRDREAAQTVKFPQTIAGGVEIAHAAEALGCASADVTVATERLRSLAATAASRFGVQQASVPHVAEAISLPEGRARDEITVASGIPRNQAWDRLAARMRIPETEPLLGAHFTASSTSDFAQLLREISSLRCELSDLTPIAPEMVRSLKFAVPRLREISGQKDCEPELRAFMVSCTRQISIACTAGFEWTRVTPREQAFFRALQEQGLLVLAERQHDLDVANQLLRPVRMKAEFVAERNQIEPFLVRSKYDATSLFRRGSPYFESLLNNPKYDWPPRVRTFLENLLAARTEYESGGKADEGTLRVAERRAFRMLLSDLKLASS